MRILWRDGGVWTLDGDTHDSCKKVFFCVHVFMITHKNDILLWSDMWVLWASVEGFVCCVIRDTG